MIRRVILFIVIFISLGWQSLYSQGQLVVSQYLNAKQYYNPSAIGLDNKFHITALHNRQLVGVDGASRSFLILANMPINLLGRTHAIGVEINTDKFGLYNTTELSTYYSWLQEIGKININIASGLIFRNSSFDGSKVNIPEGIPNTSNVDSQIPSTLVTGKGLDLSLGIYIRGYNAFLGISSRNILNTNVAISEIYQSPMTRYYNLMLGYSYNLEEYNLKFIPSTLFTINDNLFYRADFTFTSWYNDMFSFDISYRYKHAIGFGIGTKISNFNIGYRFEMLQNKALMKSNWGTHEIFVSYAINLMPQNSKRETFKSIRLL